MTINNKFNDLYVSNEFAPPGFFKSLFKSITSILFGDKDEERSIGLSRFKEKVNPALYEQPAKNQTINTMPAKKTETINTRYAKITPQKYTNTKF